MPAKKISESKCYSSGDIVFAKLKGYPWWPAKIEEECNVPTTILKAKNKKKVNSDAFIVLFFGTSDYAFCNESLLRPFDYNKVQEDIQASKFKSKYLVGAIQQALDLITRPTLNPSPSSESKGTKPTRKRSLEAIDDSHFGDDLSTNGSRRKKQGIPSPCRLASTNDRETITEDMKLQPLMQKSKYLQVVATKSPEYEKVFKRVYGYRHKLQKLIYGKKSGDIPISDYAKIDGILKDIDQCNMTKELLKDTKIAKVIRIGCEYEFGKHDSHGIQDRCLNMVKTWKLILLNQHSDQVGSTTAISMNPSSTENNTLTRISAKRGSSMDRNIDYLTAASFTFKRHLVNPHSIIPISTERHTQVNNIGSQKSKHYTKTTLAGSEYRQYSSGNMSRMEPINEKKVVSSAKIIPGEQISNTSDYFPTQHSNDIDLTKKDGTVLDRQTRVHQNDKSHASKTFVTTLPNHLAHDTDPSTTRSPTTMTDNHIPLPQVFSTSEKHQPTQ